MKDRGEFQCQERIRGSNPNFFFPKKETRILMFGKGNKNYNLSTDTASIPKAYRDRGTIPMFARIT